MNDLMIDDQGKRMQMNHKLWARWDENRWGKFWGMIHNETTLAECNATTQTQTKQRRVINLSNEKSAT